MYAYIYIYIYIYIYKCIQVEEAIRETEDGRKYYEAVTGFGVEG